MTTFTAERTISVDGRNWTIRGVRDPASCWGQAREHLTTATDWLEVDLEREDPDDTAYELPDQKLLDVVARAAPRAIRTALRRQALGLSVPASAGL